MTAQPCPDCGHDIDEKHGAAGCSEPVPGPHGLTFCECPHDAKTAKRLAAGERLARLSLVWAEIGSWEYLTALDKRYIEDTVDEILSYNHPAP